MLLRNATVISMAGPDVGSGGPADVVIEDGRIGRVATPGVPGGAGAGNGSPAAAHPDIAAELEIFVRIGLFPYEALRTATAEAARLLGLDGEIGTIERGKRADLVVLGDNPLSDVSAVRRVEGVLKDGRYFPADDRVGVPAGGSLLASPR